MVVVGGDVDEDERSDGDVAEDEEVLFSMICRVFGFSSAYFQLVMDDLAVLQWFGRTCVPVEDSKLFGFFKFMRSPISLSNSSFWLSGPIFNMQIELSGKSRLIQVQISSDFPNRPKCCPLAKIAFSLS